MITVDQELMEDVLAGAFEGGINYWADKSRLISSDEPRGDVLSNTYYAPKNFVWKLHTVEDGPTELTEAKLKAAIANHKGDPEDWDADDYDTIVQMACFGEIVYG